MKIFLTDAIEGSIFLDKSARELLEKNKFQFVDSAGDADLIVSHKWKKLLPFTLRFPRKKYLVWTNEPRYDSTFKKKIRLAPWVRKVEIMNVFSEDVFWHNHHFLGSYHFDNNIDLGIKINEFLKNINAEELASMNKQNRIAAFFSNTLGEKGKLIKDNLDIDLSAQRCRIALEGHKRNVLDIYGKGWPEGYSKENSGYGFTNNISWWDRKIEVLKSYRFNLCPENTAHPYYVTEKIWHSVKAYTLPIYSGLNSSIYESFPKDSFVELAMFKDENDLFDHCLNMDQETYLKRLNMCIDAYNNALKSHTDVYGKNMEHMVQKILHRINS